MVVANDISSMAVPAASKRVIGDLAMIDDRRSANAVLIVFVRDDIYIEGKYTVDANNNNKQFVYLIKLKR